MPLVRAAFVGRFAPEELEAMAGFWRRVEAGLTPDDPRGVADGRSHLDGHESDGDGAGS